MRRTASHVVAKSKIFARFASTFFALVPTSATLTENRGLRAAIATVSAVDVLPTPGGPNVIEVRSECFRWKFGLLTVKEYHKSLPFVNDYIVHLVMILA
jgi:hypothetical protein